MWGLRTRKSCWRIKEVGIDQGDPWTTQAWDRRVRAEDNESKYGHAKRWAFQKLTAINNLGTEGHEGGVGKGHQRWKPWSNWKRKGKVTGYWEAQKRDVGQDQGDEGQPVGAQRRAASNDNAPDHFVESLVDHRAGVSIQTDRATPLQNFKDED